MAFGTDVAARYEDWYQTPEGSYADATERELFLRLVRPSEGQRLLEVGCGTGHNLRFFGEMGLQVAGIEQSQAMLQVASSRLDPDMPVQAGSAEALPFEDRSFDIVALITVLEFSRDPDAALREAGRVAGEAVYLGVLNSVSLLAATRRAKGLFKRSSIYNQARFLSIRQLKHMVKRALPEHPLYWESALVLPLRWHRLCHSVDRKLSFRRNPFGAYLGVCIRRPGFCWPEKLR